MASSSQSTMVSGAPLYPPPPYFFTPSSEGSGVGHLIFSGENGKPLISEFHFCCVFSATGGGTKASMGGIKEAYTGRNRTPASA